MRDDKAVVGEMQPRALVISQSAAFCIPNKGNLRG